MTKEITKEEIEEINELVLQYQYCNVIIKRLYHNWEFIYKKDFEKVDWYEQRFKIIKAKLREQVWFFDYYILFYLARDLFYRKYYITCPLI